jgi:glucokinase
MIMEHFIGVDIGGTKIAAGIVSSAGKVITRREIPTPIKEGGPRILSDAIELSQLLIKSSPDHVEAIGIGAGGQIDTKQGLVYSATDVIPGWKGMKITKGFGEALNIPAEVDNDVNVLALGECRFGAAQSVSAGTIVFLALGTGVGGALVSGGSVHHGAHFTGGEFGHILLSMDPNARRDSGGAVGTLEAYCSGPGLVETWRELTGKNDSNMTGYDVVADAKKNPDGPGAQAIIKTGEYLGYGLVSLANALDPDIIIIGGGLAELGESLLQPARRVLKQHALPGPSTCPVSVASLGSDAAIIGAACLVMSGSTVPKGFVVEASQSLQSKANQNT